ncbi:NADH-quinone oxidoreductase subunit J family protein [Botryobacter ruber]|uniref:NADH-quinone oxidoreductase subunit J family protein n=1 Tax=Botryobacter ruber TaxID=2171629 RepID=UPI000E0B1FA4|nr:NADH-quinone oxidoreductase subunit J [Botryobacter ruber]
MTTESLFYFLASLTLLCALLVVISKNPIHSVLFLIVTFFTISGHYVLLNAQFLAAVNIIVYAGAIMVLFLFVIMFLNQNQQVVSTPTLSKLAGAIAGGMLLVILVAGLKDANVTEHTPGNFNSQIGMVENLGQVLYTQYLLPFELASVLFLVAMVGAVFLGKKEVGEAHF